MSTLRTKAGTSTLRTKAGTSTLATTRMSSKGQIVIPETIRKRLNLQPGAQFIVVGEDDVVILKTVVTPGLETFDRLIEEARQQARMAGLKRKDVADAVSRARDHG